MKSNMPEQNKIYDDKRGINKILIFHPSYH